MYLVCIWWLRFGAFIFFYCTLLLGIFCCIRVQILHASWLVGLEWDGWNRSLGRGWCWVCKPWMLCCLLGIRTHSMWQMVFSWFLIELWWHRSPGCWVVCRGCWGFELRLAELFDCRAIQSFLWFPGHLVGLYPILFSVALVVRMWLWVLGFSYGDQQGFSQIHI